MMMPKTKHRTHHNTTPVAGKVHCYCENCNWTADIAAEGRSYPEVMEAIYEARDAHELESTKPLSQRLAEAPNEDE